jgi:hypothetical protein
VQIAPGVDSTAFPSLSLDDPNSADWEKAIEIFRHRIEDRFIEPVDRLIELEEPVPELDRRFGFTIVAIDCLLVETLGAFILGLTDTIDKSERAFAKCLSRPLFAPYFSTRRRKHEFYVEFRCGILHQAEIGGDSRVWSFGPVLTFEPGRTIVNRTKFHELLKQEFANYQTELGDPGNVPLRDAFRKKMEFICRR